MSDDQTIAAHLAHFAAAAAGLDAVSKRNLRRDLDGIAQRLEAGAYRETDFIIRDPFDVQRRTHEYLTYIAGWKAQADRLADLLGQCRLPEASHVIELCSGWAPKMLMALASLGYDAQVTVVDGSEQALAALLDFTRVLNPSMRVATLRADVIADAPSVTGDVVIANHILDDLLLDRWARATGHAMSAIYEDTAVLREAWRGIASDRARITAELLPSIASALIGWLNPGGRLLLTHYPSNVERDLGATDVSQLFADLFVALCKELAQKGLTAVAQRAPEGMQASVMLRPT